MVVVVVTGAAATEANVFNVSACRCAPMLLGKQKLTRVTNTVKAAPTRALSAFNDPAAT